MKKLLFIPLLLFVFCANAQSKKEIKPLVQNFINSTIEGNFEEILDITYPKVFELIPREEMKEVLNQMLKNEDFEITFNKIDNKLEIGEIKEINDGKYVMIHYLNSMNMRMLNMKDVDIEMMTSLFKMSFPEGEVNYNEETQTFKIVAPSKMLGISNAHTDGKWSFINSNESDKNLINMILDKEVIKAFEL